jgi:hypothetical protein
VAVIVLSNILRCRAITKNLIYIPGEQFLSQDNSGYRHDNVNDKLYRMALGYNSFKSKFPLEPPFASIAIWRVNLGNGG